jgi:hypothetical protein
MVLERAISFCRFRIWPLLEVTEYDVPQELRNSFAQVRPLIQAQTLIRIELKLLEGCQVSYGCVGPSDDEASCPCLCASLRLRGCSMRDSQPLWH